MPTRLTIDQFIAELREKTEREGTEWEISPFGRLRTTPDWCCPLRYVFCASDYMVQAERRGMPTPVIDDLIEGADNPRPKGARARRYRAQLLAATGVANV